MLTGLTHHKAPMAIAYIALMPLKCSFTKEKMPWYPCLFTNGAYQNKVTSQNTMSRVKYVVGILLISALSRKLKLFGNIFCFKGNSMTLEPIDVSDLFG